MKKTLYHASAAVLALSAMTANVGAMNASALEVQEETTAQVTPEAPKTSEVPEKVEDAPAPAPATVETTHTTSAEVAQDHTLEETTEEQTIEQAPVNEETTAVQQTAPEATTTPEPKVTSNAASTTVETTSPAVKTQRVERQKEATKTTGKVETSVPKSGDVKEDLKTKVHTDPDKNTLGVAQSFHIFANEANLKTHTDGNVATKKLTGGEANFGTNVKSDDAYKNQFTDISYIQSVAPGVNIQSSSGVAERDTLLVVGKEIAVSVVDNGNYYALNNQKMDHIKQIAQDKDTTYIDFEQEFSNLRAVSQSFSTGETAAATLARQGSNYTLDLSKYEIKDGQIVLNLDANDLTDESGDLTVAGIPDGAIVVVNVKAANAQQTLDIQKKIVLSYANGTTRYNQETENFTDSTLLWNFESFNGLINLQKAWQGTILATDASLYSDSNIDGSIIVDKFLGAGETHRWDFQGTITPKEPTTEETPDKPTTEEVTPDEPTEEVTPDEPTEEVTPDEPTEEVTPDEPKEEVTPDEPTEEVTPDEPKEEVTPDEPTEEVTPDEPKEEVTPDEPTEEVTPDEPTEEVTPDEPKEEVTPDEPKEEVTPDEPKEEVTPDEPTEEVTPDEPTTEEVTPDEPTTEEVTPDEPTTEPTPDVPVIVTPPVESIVEKPTLETPIEETVVDDPTAPIEEIADEKVELVELKPIQTPKTQQPISPTEPTLHVATELTEPTIIKQPSSVKQVSTATVSTPTTPIETASSTDMPNVTTATGLPQTGEQSATATWIGLGALLAGAAALLFNRRKKTYK